MIGILSTVSVIIPILNGLPWIKESLNSILNQTYKDIEIILIDDGSTDGTLEYLKSVKDSRIKMFSFPKNQGIVSALNKGIDLAKGAFIARMDSDDIAESDRFEKQIDFLTKNEDYVLVASKIRTFTHESTVCNYELKQLEDWYNNGLSNVDITAILPIGNCLNHPSVMMRAEVLKKSGGYLSGYQYAEDYELFLRLSKYGKIAKLNDVLLHYRVHQGQISTARRNEQRLVDAKIKVNYLINYYLDNEKSVCIWGAGNGGQLIQRALKENGIATKCFFDKDGSKWGKQVEGVLIMKPSTLTELDKVFLIIATTPGRIEVVNYCKELGLEYGKDFLPVW